MKLLDPIKKKIGWAWLMDHLNELIGGTNARTIIPAVGGGIDIQETENGTLIALTSSGALKKGGSGTTGGAWLTVDVMDSSCHRSTIQVWSRPVPTGGGGA